MSAYLLSAKSLRWNVAFVPDERIQFVESVLLETDNGENGTMVTEHKYKFCYHFYMMQRPEIRSRGDLFGGDCAGGDEGDMDSVIAANHLLLPANEFIGLWDNLVYEEGLKEKVGLSVINKYIQ